MSRGNYIVGCTASLNTETALLEWLTALLEYLDFSVIWYDVLTLGPRYYTTGLNI